MQFTWTDTSIIAEELYDKHPKINPQYIRFTDLHKMIRELDGFVEGEVGSNEKILEAIQAAWIIEAQD